MELQGRWNNGIKARLSYALQETKDQETKDLLTNSPKQTIKLNGVLPLLKDKVFLGIEEQYTGSRKTLAGHHVNGFFVTHATLFSQNVIKGLEMSATVYNLFNRKYDDPGGGEHLQDKIEQDGTTFRLKVTYRF